MSGQQIEVHIGRLVVDGRSQADAQAIARSLRRAIAARLLAGGVPPAWHGGATVARIDAGVPGAADAGTIGRHVAGALTSGAGGRR